MSFLENLYIFDIQEYLFPEVRPFLCHPEGFPDASASGGIFLAVHLVNYDDENARFAEEWKSAHMGAI